MKNGLKMLMVVGVFAIFAFAPVNETKTVVTPAVEVCVEDNATDWFWVSCSVSDGESSVTVYRADNNMRKACRQARRMM